MRRERSRQRGNEPPGSPLLSKVCCVFEIFFLVGLLYFSKTNLILLLFTRYVPASIYRALLFIYSSNEEHCYCRTFYEKVFSFDLFARVLRSLFASRLLWRDFERPVGWTAHTSEREKSVLARCTIGSNDRAKVPAKSVHVQIRRFSH